MTILLNFQVPLDSAVPDNPSFVSSFKTIETEDGIAKISSPLRRDSIHKHEVTGKSDHGQKFDRKII